jgi:hypothetical protein
MTVPVGADGASGQRFCAAVEEFAGAAAVLVPAAFEPDGGAPESLCGVQAAPTSASKADIVSNLMT